MEDEYESQWKDRCERYFSSISDTGKDRDQEKHGGDEQRNTRENHASNELLVNEEKVWKDLSEVRNALSEHWLIRKARSTLFMLDVHGSKVASKTKSSVGFVFWLFIVLCFIIFVTSRL